MRSVSIRGAATALFVALLSLHWAAPTAQAAPEYSLTDLGTLGGRLYSIFSPNVGDAGQAYDLNNAGQIVGYSYLPNNESSRPFLYQNGAMSVVQTTGGTATSARGINDLGHIVGRINVSGQTRNYLLANGVTTLLPLHPEPLTYDFSPRDLSNGGIVHGSLINRVTGVVHAGVYNNGTFMDLGTFAANNAGDSDATDVNDSGAVVGWAYNDAGNARAFVYQNGVMTNLGTLGNGLKSYATAINESGQVVGYGFIDAAGQIDRSFLYDNGQLITLPLPGPSTQGPFSESRALDLNDHGIIVGFGQHGSGATRAAVWRDGVGTDLNLLLDASGNGWVLRGASFINNAGQIVGHGTRPDGHSHMYLLTPIPEPASAATMAVGGVMLLRRRRRSARQYHRASAAPSAAAERFISSNTLSFSHRRLGTLDLLDDADD